MENDTIVAIITPLGTGGIAALRLSGKNSLHIINKIFKGTSPLSPRMVVFGTIKTEVFSDDVLAVYFKAPNSFTGEDCVEIFTHGGMQIAKGALEECFKHGARMAENGEFSKRAVMNGKMDLSQAEGIVDMINATTNAQVRAGYNLLRGGFAEKVSGVQEKLTNCLAQIEVSLDYPEHDIEYQTIADIKKTLEEVLAELNALLATQKTGMMIKQGVNVVIAGRPNVGKSSLLNALLGFERSIVTDEQGTTRDVVKESFVYKDMQFNLSDTAGLRKTEQRAEQIGVERAYAELDSADLILFVLDGSVGVTEEDEKALKLINDKNHIIIVNKTDAGKGLIKNKDYYRISAKTKQGVDGLKEKMFNAVFDKNILSNENIITNIRHAQNLSAAAMNLNSCLENIEGATLDCSGIYIKSAWQTLGEITGTTSNEDVLDAIFSKFCLGK